jgi:hypothetical protein
MLCGLPQLKLFQNIIIKENQGSGNMIKVPVMDFNATKSSRSLPFANTNYCFAENENCSDLYVPAMIIFLIQT